MVHKIILRLPSDFFFDSRFADQRMIDGAYFVYSGNSKGFFATLFLLFKTNLNYFTLVCRHTKLLSRRLRNTSTVTLGELELIWRHHVIVAGTIDSPAKCELGSVIQFS